MREVLICLERPVLQQLRRQGTCISVGNDLIVLTMHHEHRDSDFFEILGEISL